MSMIPASWMPNVPMKRLIGHWTAGGHKANATDKRAYHVLVEGDGNVLKGNPSIASNSGRIHDGYAAHTLNCNTDSIGISMCGMMDAVEVPFNAGPAPITKVQWVNFVVAVAELCRFYEIPVTPKTVLFHAEVEANLGIKQRNKWDVVRLVFDPTVKGAKAVGDKLRREVSEILGGQDDADKEPVPAGGLGQVTASLLITRDSPNGDRNGELPQGTQVEVIGVDGDWLNVRSPAGYEVWVSRAYIKMVDGPPAVGPTKPDPRRLLIAEMRAKLDELEASIGE